MNSYYIVNIYREPNTLYTIKYVTGLKPLPKMLIKDNFNTCHELFEPDIKLVL